MNKALEVQFPYIFAGLNEQQQEAVAHITGPVLILAGAGSGKTKTLTHRIAFLIASGISPHNILAITFTNKAAAEMKDRIYKLLAEHSENGMPPTMPLIGTFHSVCLRMLRREAEYLGFKKSFLIYDTDDSVTLMKNIMEELEINPKKFSPKTMLNKISQLKSELKHHDTYANEAKEYTDKLLASLYSSYQTKLKANNAMDFDDLIMYPVLLFRKHPEVLERYQNVFKYILVDEYQDTNHAQYQWVTLLAQKDRNLAIVGDDAQSIYGWRQADIRNILNFEKDYPEAKVIILEQNYRSTQTILDAANSIISKNQNKKDKNLWTSNPKGEKIIIKELDDDREEGEYVAHTINQHIREGTLINGYTILYRTHAQSRSIEETMIKHGLPYRIVGGVKFYQRREIKDILAYMRLAMNPNDMIALERIYNVPTRGIGPTSFQKIIDSQTTLRDIFEDDSILETNLHLSKKPANALRALAKLLGEIHEEATKLNPSELIKLILKKTDYRSYINDGTADGEERWENVQELFTATKKYDEGDIVEGLERFLEEVALIQETDGLDNGNTVINMMTIHSSKGLEFPIVFVIGMEEGIFPHSRALFNPTELEEERRLCYVAVTRAQKLLYLTFCRQRMLYGSVQVNPPSRFISEIPDHLTDFVDSEHDPRAMGSKNRAKKKWGAYDETAFSDSETIIDY